MIGLEVWQHNVYPHEPGTLYGCLVCETECFCKPGEEPCVYCSQGEEDLMNCL